jgi:hypothetical protein
LGSKWVSVRHGFSWGKLIFRAPGEKKHPFFSQNPKRNPQKEKKTQKEKARKEKARNEKARKFFFFST